jgi:hypothetical protein
VRVPIAMQGVLGWGNRKGGYEAYGPEGRWGGQGHYADHGDLLGDALERSGAAEGDTLVVVVVPRRKPDHDRWLAEVHAALSRLDLRPADTQEATE